MALNHTHMAFPNFVLENTIEDQYNSHLDLMRFCTVDNSLVGVAGDIKKIRVYSATNGTEKLAMGDGNTKNIEVAYENNLPFIDPFTSASKTCERTRKNCRRIKRFANMPYMDNCN